MIKSVDNWKLFNILEQNKEMIQKKWMNVYWCLRDIESDLEKKIFIHVFIFKSEKKNFKTVLSF